MFDEFMFDFAEYLNLNGYSISAHKIENAISSIKSSGINISDEEDIIPLLRMHYCMNKKEYKEFAFHFRTFFKEKDEIKKRKEEIRKAKAMIPSKEKELDEEKKNYLKKAGEISDSIREERERQNHIGDELQKNWSFSPAALSKSEEKFVKDNLKWLKSKKDKATEAVLNNKHASDSDFTKAINNFMEHMKEAVLKGNAADIQKCKKWIATLKRFQKNNKSESEEFDAQVRREIQKSDNRIKSLMSESKKLTKQHEIKQIEINSLLRELRSKTIEKEQSSSHRKEFVNPNNFVRNTGDYKEKLPFENVTFEKLTAGEKTALRRYIKDNLIKFKTRLSRRLYDYSHGQIDMCRTIQDACRTGGMPINIMRQQKRAGKTNLVLVLDVSGSCKQASAMMLSFMYLLSEVFPKGCKAFAFVNSLYDISGVMESKDIDIAIKKTMDIIPTAGQYSNYERPIKEIWSNYKQSINKESIVIFMGDARNNKNDPAIQEFKNIARRAKSMYWLNTDDFNKWDTGDSIASKYARYCKMVKTETVGDILFFISEVLK